MTAGGGSIEAVRGHLPDERAEEILGFWSSHGALEGEAARQRLAEVVCVALDDADEMIGVNSAKAEDVSPVGRFWRYHSVLPGGNDELAAAMFNAAFEALGDGFDPDAPGPIGLAVNVSDTAGPTSKAITCVSATSLGSAYRCPRPTSRAILGIPLSARARQSRR